ncbi:MAG: type II toxin-antitoxin system Phd/YefM family antitoxin [Rhodoferax sp.]
MQIIPFSEVRAQLAEVLRGVESGEAPMVISRRGHASGVLMSYAQYQQLSGEALGFADRLQAWRAQHLAAGAGAPDADPFEGVRQRDEARPFTW